MAHKTKTTLTQAQWEKIKRANAMRTREVREKEKKGKDGEREDRGKRADKKECKEEGVVKKMRRGLKALKEIKGYQTGMEMLIRRLPIQRVVKEITQGIRADLRFQSMAVKALQEAEEAFLVGLLEQGNLCA